MLDLLMRITITQWATLGACALLLVLLMSTVVSVFRPTRGDVDLSRMTRRPRLLGAAGLFLFFGAGGLWAAFAPLAGAAIAPGVVSPEGRRLTVQHLEGGVIAELHVREGDQVSRGDPLVTLANVRAQSERDSLYYERLALLLEEARLLASVATVAPGAEAPGDRAAADTAETPADAGTSPFTPPPAVRVAASDPAVAQMISAAERLSINLKRTRAARDRVFDGRIAELNGQINGLEEAEQSLDRQISLIKSEIADLSPLVDQGLTPRSRLLALRREEARLDGSLRELAARRSVTLEAIANVELERAGARETDRREASERLLEVRRRLNQIQSQLPSSEDELARTLITAPADGIVVEMQVSTIGGVVRSGAPLLDLLPTRADLVINARLNPRDIDEVVAGQEARIVLSAYRQRNMPFISGVVESVSADRLVDDATNEPYFRATVSVPPEELARVGDVSDQDIALIPGMPAEVMIMVRERTMIAYLFAPFAESFRRSFRES